MNRLITTKERETLLLTRVRRLQFFAETFRGRPNYLIETGAYSVLEAHQSRPRAIWRYFCFAVRSWRNSWIFTWTYTRRVWWYRYAIGLSKEGAHAVVCGILEEKFLAEDKESHGRSN